MAIVGVGLGLKMYNLIHHTILMCKGFFSKCKNILDILEDHHKAILSAGAIATACIMLVSLLVLYSSNEAILETNEKLLAANEKLLERVPPIEPSLIITNKQSKKGLVFLASRLADIRPTPTGELVRSEGEIRFAIKNIGQTETGSVNLKLFGDWIYPRHEHLILDELDSDRVEFRIWYDKCSLDSTVPPECVAKNVPVGPQNLTLKVKCEMCRNTTLTHEFEICIKYNGTECDDWLEN